MLVNLLFIRDIIEIWKSCHIHEGYRNNVLITNLLYSQLLMQIAKRVLLILLALDFLTFLFSNKEENT